MWAHVHGERARTPKAERNMAQRREWAESCHTKGGSQGRSPSSFLLQKKKKKHTSSETACPRVFCHLIHSFPIGLICSMGFGRLGHSWIQKAVF